MNTKLAIGLLVVAVVVAGVVLPRPLPTQVVREVVEKLGAFPGPDMLSDYFGFNGVQRFYVRQVMNTATITPCVIDAPRQGTTTLVYTSMQFDTSTTSGVSVATIAKNVAGTYATSSSLADVILSGPSAGGAATESISITGSSTLTSGFVSTAGNTRFQFKPGDRLVFGYAGGQHPTASYPTGSCQAEFIKY